MTAAVRRRRLGFARSVGAVMAVALLSACSSNPEPGPLPHSSTPVQATTGTPSPASDPAPSPDGPPTLPAAARGNGPRSAKAFVRYYIATLNFAAQTGETRALRRSSSDSCAACGAIARFIDRTYEESGYIKGHGWKPVSFQVVDAGTSRSLVVDVVVTVSPQVVVAKSGAAPKRYDGGRRLKTFWLSRIRHAWSVDRLDQAT